MVFVARYASCPPTYAVLNSFLGWFIKHYKGVDIRIISRGEWTRQVGGALGGLDEGVRETLLVLLELHTDAVQFYGYTQNNHTEHSKH